MVRSLAKGIPWCSKTGGPSPPSWRRWRSHSAPAFSRPVRRAQPRARKQSPCRPWPRPSPTTTGRTRCGRRSVLLAWPRDRLGPPVRPRDPHVAATSERPSSSAEPGVRPLQPLPGLSRGRVNSRVHYRRRFNQHDRVNRLGRNAVLGTEVNSAGSSATPLAFAIDICTSGDWAASGAGTVVWPAVYDSPPSVLAGFGPDYYIDPTTCS